MGPRTRLKYWLRAVLATKLISLQTNLQELTSTVSVFDYLIFNYTHVRVRMHTRTLQPFYNRWRTIEDHSQTSCRSVGDQSVAA